MPTLEFLPQIMSHRREACHEVLDDVVGMLEAGREAQESVADAELGARLRGQALMRGGGGMRDQALGVAQIVADAHELERVLEAERRRFAALDLEGDQRRARTHLAQRDRGLRMVRSE